MAYYTVQWYMGSSWIVPRIIEADSDEEAKEAAINMMIGIDRIAHEGRKMRISKIIFEGMPEETGYEFPMDEVTEDLLAMRVRQEAEIALMIENASNSEGDEEEQQ